MIITIEELRNYKKARDYVNSKLLDAFATCEELGIDFTNEYYDFIEQKAIEDLENMNILELN